MTNNNLGEKPTRTPNIFSASTKEMGQLRFAKKINGYLNLTIPTLFLIFNVVYWTILIPAKI
jgi:hypothetical protein